MSMAMPGMSQNAMYSTSDEQRSEANKRLVAASISGMLKDSPSDAELAIATTVALCIRDVSRDPPQTWLGTIPSLDGCTADSCGRD